LSQCPGNRQVHSNQENYGPHRHASAEQEEKGEPLDYSVWVTTGLRGYHVR
jgi:hypothetical protein